MIEKYYTPEEIAEILSVTSQTVRRWAQSGKLRAAHLSQKNIRVKESDLEAFLEQQSSAPVKKTVERAEKESK